MRTHFCVCGCRHIGQTVAPQLTPSTIALPGETAVAKPWAPLFHYCIIVATQFALMEAVAEMISFVKFCACAGYHCQWIEW